MKLSNLDFLCSVPLKHATSAKSSDTLEGTSLFQALFTELQVPAFTENEVSSENTEEALVDEAVVEETSDVKQEDIPVEHSFSDFVKTAEPELDLKLAPKPLPLPLPEFFVELPRRPVTVVDLPEPTVPLPSAPLFVRSERFEGEDLRKIESNLMLTEQGKQTEKISSQKIYIEEHKLESNSPLRTIQPEPVQAPLVIQQSEQVSEPQALPVIELRLPEEVPDLQQQLRQEVPRVLLAPIKDVAAASGGTFRIQIFPEHLGHIDLMVSVEEGQVTAKMITSSHLAKDVLELQLPQLRQQLLDQGVAMEAFEIEWREEKEAPQQQAREQQAEARKQHPRNHGSLEQDETEREPLPEEGIDYSV